MDADPFAVPARRSLGPTRGSTARSVPLKPGALLRFSAVFLPELFISVPASTLRSSKTSEELVPSLPAAREKPSGLCCPRELRPWRALAGWPEPGECRGKAGMAPAPPAGRPETPRALPCIPVAGASLTLAGRVAWTPPLPTPCVPGVSHSTRLPPGSHLRALCLLSTTHSCSREAKPHRKASQDTRSSPVLPEALLSLVPGTFFSGAQ